LKHITKDSDTITGEAIGSTHGVTDSIDREGAGIRRYDHCLSDIITHLKYSSVKGPLVFQISHLKTGRVHYVFESIEGLL
jgi:hypothetical protein